MKARGLGRVYKRKKSKSLWIEYCYRGKSHRESVARALRKSPRDVTPTDATRLLKKRLGEGRPVGREAERITFDDLARMVVDDYAVPSPPATRPPRRLEAGGGSTGGESMFTRYALNDVPALERAVAKLAALDAGGTEGES